LTAKPAAFILNHVVPDDHIFARGNVVVSEHISLAMVSGCDATEAVFLLVSALLAIRMRFEERIKGVVFGVIFLFAINFIRIVGLYLVGRHRLELMGFVHLYVGQAFIILMASAFFLFWINRDLNRNGQENTH
jgi:exosortase family protein XrtM